MFSLIIPTLWKYPPFISFLNDLMKFNIIDDIIIISNSTWPDEMREVMIKYSGNPKLRIFYYGKNIFVNPSWNRGMELVKNNKVCILNDDLILDLRVFMHIDKLLDDPTIGVIGTAPGDHPITGQPKLTTGAIDIIPHTTEHLWGFGYAMFIHKRNWEPIPEEIKVFAGDNWIFDGCKQRGLTNYLITNFLWNTPGSVTSRFMEKEYGNRDKELYAKHNTERMKKYAI